MNDDVVGVVPAGENTSIPGTRRPGRDADRLPLATSGHRRRHRVHGPIGGLLGILVPAMLAATTMAQEAFEGYTLISPRTLTSSYLIDMNYNVIQTWHGASSVAQVAYMLPDGSLLRPCADPNAQWGAGGTGGRIQRINANDNVVWDYIFSDAVRQQHHDIEPMPNGNVLMLGWERKTLAEAIAAGRQSVPFGEIWPTVIAEVQPVGATGGNVVWEWHFWDHVIQDADSTKANYGVVADHPELVDINWANAQNGSWDHANAVGYNPQLDQIVFSARAMSEVYVIDHSTTTAEAAGHTGGNSGKGGDILYRWGNPQVYDRGTAGDQYFFSVHGATWIDPGLPGAGGLLIFNNGNRPGTGNDYSGVVEIHPPTDGHGNYLIASGEPYEPIAPSWVYEDPPVFYSQNKGGAYRLPNGNTIVTEANDNNIFEVTAAGVKVWQYTPPGEVHRAKRYWNTTTGVAGVATPRARLDQNFPNPFNPSTTITFTLGRRRHVVLAIYDAAGRHTRTLVSGVRSAAVTHRTTWDGTDDNGQPVASGIYYCRLFTGGTVVARKLVLLR